ncbi:DUF1566 domain-containing protein [Cupriavidus sp. CV2]|uniref:DUF1566 domain-containing protein n=1 Tax=Cupriavidus ulmosensis TaxID=3065913 RepID=UPI00296AF4BB|nr:DUF1566 domain-containing protein [Cupriavidus sp. CV2]MDW3683902.1 DUF1566 domain-containing protein [Cupriavidus sp. CV2]
MTQVAENVAVEVGGAQVLIPKETVVKSWLASVIGAVAPATGLQPEPVSIADLRPGELYAGIILGKNGEPSHRLILLPGAAEDLTWEQAKEWATSVGGELPTRREQSLLFANLKEEFEGTWYWSGEQYAGGSHYAWGQNFNGGLQDSYRKYGEFRARAVRRLAH